MSEQTKLLFPTPIKRHPNLNGWWDVRENGMVGPFETKAEADKHRHTELGNPVGRVVKIEVRA